MFAIFAVKGTFSIPLSSGKWKNSSMFINETKMLGGKFHERWMRWRSSELANIRSRNRSAFYSGHKCISFLFSKHSPYVEHMLVFLILHHWIFLQKCSFPSFSQRCSMFILSIFSHSNTKNWKVHPFITQRLYSQHAVENQICFFTFSITIFPHWRSWKYGNPIHVNFQSLHQLFFRL